MNSEIIQKDYTSLKSVKISVIPLAGGSDPVSNIIGGNPCTG